MTGCREPGPATNVDGQPSPERALETVGRATWLEKLSARSAQSSRCRIGLTGQPDVKTSWAMASEKDRSLCGIAGCVAVQETCQCRDTVLEKGT